MQEYFLGGRELGGLLLAMTMIATYGSASSFIGGPGIAYNMGLGWVLLSAIQVVTGYIVLTVIGKKFAIIARKMEAITLIDYLKEDTIIKQLSYFLRYVLLSFYFQQQ